MQKAICALLHTSAAFVDLLSLGFATIGVSATLLSVGSQLLADALRPLASRQRRAVA